ncbi:MAG: hypothetical protein WD064_03335, partial [Acidimicrobiia bacterium]
ELHREALDRLILGNKSAFIWRELLGRGIVRRKEAGHRERNRHETPCQDQHHRDGQVIHKLHASARIENRPNSVKPG